MLRRKGTGCSRFSGSESLVGDDESELWLVVDVAFVMSDACGSSTSGGGSCCAVGSMSDGRKWSACTNRTLFRTYTKYVEEDFTHVTSPGHQFTSCPRTERTSTRSPTANTRGEPRSLSADFFYFFGLSSHLICYVRAQQRQSGPQLPSHK